MAEDEARVVPSINQFLVQLPNYPITQLPNYPITQFIYCSVPRPFEGAGSALRGSFSSRIAAS
jgi:hypothetical protein